MQVYPPGARIAGRYLVSGHPLMGGMGLVYLCLDLEDQRPVALKTFRPELLPNRSARDRFLREGTHWVDLGAHPHIVRCYQVVRIGDGTEVFLALELVAKEQGRADASLRSWLHPGHPLARRPGPPLCPAGRQRHGPRRRAPARPRPPRPQAGKPPRRRRQVVRWQCQPPAHHRPGPGRRPGRSRPTAAWSPGTARLGGPPAPHPAHAGIAGTPPYMAPEQWRGEPATAATDIYAWAASWPRCWPAGGRSRGQPGRPGAGPLLRPGAAPPGGGARPGPRRGGPLPGPAAGGALRDLAPGRGGPGGRLRRGGRPPGPGPEPAAALDRAERVAAGWSFSNMGMSYLDLGQAETALGYFERARAAGAAEEERRLEGAGLGHLGLAYAALGEARRATGCYEQALAIHREIGDRQGEGLSWAIWGAPTCAWATPAAPPAATSSV